MKIADWDSIPFHLKLFAWLNISVQASFPLAAAFTPTIAGAGSSSHFLQNQAQVTLQTRTYTLSDGETTTSVAKKYNISLEQLRKLNQFRTFAHGFDHLQPGDELDVPLSSLPTVQWEDGKGGAFTVADDTRSDERALKVASTASQASGFLANHSDSGATASIVRGMATGVASSEVQQWLNHFGTARVQLSVDKKLSLKNSQLDLLVPLYEQKDSLVFTQVSLHRTDDRTQSNLGVGFRWFANDWMLGGNTFLDYDLSRDHARLGLGVEYMRDFLKLGVNSYHRLTSWKNSPALEDYEERPANGWDIRAQAWLPALPQLGGKLTYEQYYGNEVALFGKDNLQKNPHAITAGISYTPVPLLTFGAEQRQGKSGKNDTRFGVEINYQLGIPWRKQVNPDAVVVLRSLAGSRYDLVERNNNIVLEYRKKEVIWLKAADLVTGYTGEQKSLGVSVTSKYGLERIDWSASSLIAAGGKIVQSGTDWTVTMPDWRPGPEGVNTYIISGVAVDKKGNTSNQSKTQVTVQTPVVSAIHSTFTPAQSLLLADRKSSQVLTLTVMDDRNQPVDISASEADFMADGQADAVVSSPERKSPGVITVTVTAGTQPTTLTLTPVVRGVKLPSVKVTISDTTPDAQQSSFTASPVTIPADNNTSSVLTLTLKNKDGLALSAQKDRLSMALTANNGRSRSAQPVTISDITESQSGIYTATLKGAQAGEFTVIPQYNGNALGSLAATVTLTAGSAVQVNSTIKTSAASYVAGADMNLTVTLKDANGNTVSGQAAALTAESVTVPGTVMKSGRWTDNGDGSYSATYTAKSAGTDLKATLKLSGWSSASQSGAYAITAGSAVQVNSTIKTSATSYMVRADMTITVTLKDAHGNPVTGESAALTAEAVTVPNAELKGSWRDNADGTYTATYTVTNSGTGLRATLKLADWSAQVESNTYSIDVMVGNRVVSGIQHLDFYPRNISVLFTPDPDNQFDDTCFTVKGTAGVNNNLTAISAWGNTSMAQNSAGNYTYNLTVSNSCAYTVSGKIKLQFSRSDASAPAITESITVESY